MRDIDFIGYNNKFLIIVNFYYLYPLSTTKIHLEGMGFVGRFWVL